MSSFFQQILKKSSGLNKVKIYIFISSQLHFGFGAGPRPGLLQIADPINKLNDRIDSFETIQILKEVKSITG